MIIKINILFWGNSKERLDNTNLSLHYLKKFCIYAQDKGLPVEPFLFDLSEDKVLDEAIHISYPNNTYKRSEKINRVIDYHGEYDGLFAIMDSDLIINPEEYDALIYLLTKTKPNEYYVFKVNDVQNLEGIYFENKEVDFSKLNYVSRAFEPDLGGLFFIESKVINENRFDEEFIVWGGEDNNLSYRLQAQGKKKKLLPIVPYHLPHEHALKQSDMVQYNKQVQKLRR